ncbi:MAG TPA: hypothetical protein VFF90_00730 [Saprospiraceae bacterium]|nr:hypothetical protein [Saprospiraceae bacterium]
MEKKIKSTEQQIPPQKEKQLKRPEKTAPGPGGSQESERMEYHEEPAQKRGRKYDHHSEKKLED